METKKSTEIPLKPVDATKLKEGLGKKLQDYAETCKPQLVKNLEAQKSKE